MPSPGRADEGSGARLGEHRRSVRVVPNLDQLASWWHSDTDLGRPVECFTDMSKSRRLGFPEYQETLGSFPAVYRRLQAERILP